MPALVIKEWVASNAPIDTEGHFVRIKGRSSGLLSFLLALLKVDPTTMIRVSASRVEFSGASLAGTTHRMIPLDSVSSTYYGYHKPWKAAVSLAVSMIALTSGLFPNLYTNLTDERLGLGYFLFAILASVGIAIVYYLLRRTFTLGFVEHSGHVNAIVFRRSVIENVEVNEEQARYICEISQYLIEASRSASRATQ